MNARTVPPLALVAGAAALQVALAPHARPTRGSLAAALPIGGLAAGLLGAAALQFRRARTTVDPVHPDRANALVVSGANGLTRNPMYVGMASALTAHAVVRRSWVGTIPVVGFVTAVTVGQIAAEERALRSRFGEPYERYLDEVPRWLDTRTLRAAAPMARGAVSKWCTAVHGAR